jgi:hypothetical protein
MLMNELFEPPRIPGTLYKISFNSNDIWCFCVSEQTLKLISRTSKGKIVTYLGKGGSISDDSILEFEELFLFNQQVGYFICTNDTNHDPIDQLLAEVK